VDTDEVIDRTGYSPDQAVSFEQSAVSAVGTEGR
jgi:hypothetical protein